MFLSRLRSKTRIVALLVVAVLLGGTAIAEEAPEDKSFIPKLAESFQPILNVNLRWEYAKINGFQHSHGATAR